MHWHYDKEIRIKILNIPPYENNCYIIACPHTDTAVIIDAPGSAGLILPETEGLDIRLIIMTHSHEDHTEALKQMQKKLNIPVAAHPAEAGDYPVIPEVLLDDGQVITLGSVRLNVIHTPGHTPGSICLLTGRHLFSGDTLFPGGPGNTPEPIAFKQIINSLKKKIFILPDETIIYPGHGAHTTLGKEKQEFVVFYTRKHSSDLCGDVVWLNS